MQRVTPLISDLFINTGSGRVAVSDPSTVTTLPQRDHIDLAAFPATVPDIINPTSLCSVWTKQANHLTAERHIVTADTIPIDESSAPYVVKLVPPVGGVDQADAALTRPGRGWYVRVTGEDASSLAAEQVWFIDDTGRAYAIGPEGASDNNGISYTKTVEMLGLNVRTPLPIPWSFLSLFGRGPTLDPAFAKTEHQLTDPDDRQVPLPEPKQPGSAPAEPSGN